MGTFILPGRHQPPHNDHLALIRAALAQVPPDSSLAVGLVFARPAAGRPLDPFDAEAREHHDPARCPFSVLERMAMLEAALDAELRYADRRRVRVIPLPRPEADWALVEAMLPGPRTWIVPEVGEDFDDAKAAFFRARGDRVVRVRVRTTTDGRTVRALLDDPERLARHVPAAVARCIANLRRETEVFP